jgi:hypothetical protein
VMQPGSVAEYLHDLLRILRHSDINL